MNILIVSSSITKGAGIISVELLKLFLAKGNRCSLLTLHDKSSNGNIISLLPSHPNSFKIKLVRLIRFALNGFFRRPPLSGKYYYRDYFSMIPMASRARIASVLPFQPDHVVVVFNENLLTFSDLAWLSHKYGSIIHFYLMDMSAMTGGCHYNVDCLGYQKKCDNCPAVGVRYKKLVKEIAGYKSQHIKNIPATAIAISEWQIRQLNESVIFKDKPKYKVLLGVESGFFDHDAKMLAKSRFDFQDHDTCLLIGAANFEEERKGGQKIIDAFQRMDRESLKRKKLKVLIVGGIGRLVDKLTDLPLEIKQFGYLSQEELGSVYLASDVFLSASLQDTGPRMVNEAMMNGVPVIAFEVGVAVDLVVDGVTGFLAKTGDGKSFANSIDRFLALSDEKKKVMSNRCREKALHLSSLEVQYKGFMEIFEASELQYSKVGH